MDMIYRDTGLEERSFQEYQEEGSVLVVNSNTAWAAWISQANSIDLLVTDLFCCADWEGEWEWEGK